MNATAELADRLAQALVAGELTQQDVLERAERALGRSYRWLTGLAERIDNTFAGRTRPTSRQLARHLLEDAGFLLASSRCKLRIAASHAELPTMAPARFAREWQVPPLTTEQELAAWLGLSPRQLVALADPGGHSARASQEPHRHYRYRLLTKPGGAIRLIEAPKERLKQTQKKILHGLLEQVPLHDAAHGFRRGGSSQTFALPHVRQQVVIRVDLADFFPSISSSRVGGIFRAMGYPQRVSQLLTGLVTNTASADLFPRYPQRQAEREAQIARYCRPHLPQGAPTSPYLANLAAFRLDQRLAGLARSCDGVYSRYADDLAFSGGQRLDRGAQTFSTHVAAIAMEEGFVVNFRKTRLMRRSTRQHLAGLVVNDRLNIRRDDYDQLKAILYNASRLGLASQNHHAHPEWRAHLQGRVASVRSLTRARGDKLQHLLDRALAIDS